MSRAQAQDLIRKKREGDRLSLEEIESLVGMLVDGTMADAQVGAFAMAVLFRGMEPAESAALTHAMARSGHMLSWRSLDLGGPILDKHSTGGVGDKTSLMLAPIVAASGGFVPMISGRALGHTGGTVDKFESIPGYSTQPTLEHFRRIVAEVGCAVIGQTDELAPADRRLYAIRDVTATVDSIPLITASILSKKLAAGLDGLVMDVKFGSGAFMVPLDQARTLAESIVSVAGNAGLKARALLTDMNQVLGRNAGNALEVAEAIAYLTGTAREPRLDRVTRALSAELLLLGGLAGDAAEAEAKVDRALGSGEAAERFQRMVASLGGPSDLVDRPAGHLPAAPIVLPIPPPRRGHVQRMDTAAVGRLIVGLGGGRTAPGERIDPAVGLSEVAGIGERVGPDRPLAIVHARDETDARIAMDAFAQAVTISDRTPSAEALIAGRL